MELADTLDTIMSRLAGKAGADGLAIFVKPNGDVKMTAASTSLFKDMVRIHPEWLLGVYDEDADDRWIAADLRWAAENMAEA